MDEEKIEQLAVLDRNYSQTAEQIQMVEQEMSELSEFLKSLEHLSKSDEKSMLAPLGRGIYAAAERLNNEKLFVEVGSGVVVRKSVPEAASVVKQQLARLSEILAQLKVQESFYAAQLQSLLEQAEKTKSE